MRRLLPLLLSLLLAVSLAVPAFAEEDSGSPSPDTSSSDTDSPSSSGDSSSIADSSANNSSDADGESPADTSADIPDTAVSADATTSDEGGVTVNVTIQQPSGDETVPEDTASPLEDIPAFVPDDSEDAAAYRTFTVVSPNDDETVPSSDGSSAMADVVVSVLGEYRRKTQTVTEMDSEGNVLAVSTEIVPGLAGLDYEWIAGAVLFALFLFSLMKLIGGLLKL